MLLAVRVLTVLMVASCVVALRTSAPPARGVAPATGGTLTAPFPAPSAGSQRRGLRYDGVAPRDREAIEQAIAGARPEARRLIAAVAGLTTVRVGPAGPGASGWTAASPDGYVLQLDLAQVSGPLGMRGVDRLVLHELGHVVDFALVDDALGAALDAEVPRGYGCADGVTGSCAPQRERFAETFAKWAMDDIGLNLEIGYRVPPPVVPLATWGAPLARLAG